MWQKAPGLTGTTFQDISGDVMLPEGTDRDTLLARFHVRRADGTVVAGARAFLALFRGHRVLRPLGIALDRQPFIAMLDLLYTGFLRIRRLWRRPPSRTPPAAS